MSNIIKKVKGRIKKAIVKYGTEISVINFKKEDIQIACRRFRISSIIISVLLLLISMLILLKWKIVGVIFLILSGLYIITLFRMYARMKIYK